MQIPVMIMLARSGTWNSSDTPMAPPTNSARSVAIAATSATTHIAHTAGRGNWARHSSARLRPVTMPSLAESPWNSIAMTFASSTTQSRS